MKSLLLTGVTGMLGHFLLRDWLQAGQRIVVIARDRRMISARQRIDQIVSGLELKAQRFLPRPIVLAGDIHRQGLGLSAADTEWVTRNCDSILHSAASVKFDADESEDRLSVEPYLSNVVGTRNVLEFCRQTGIENFHHVSTAYVCGQQTERVGEKPAGQVRFGNDYQASKAEAESLVRQASYLKAKTFLRPAIIVGDSDSGYTTSFHGIYTALQLGYLFVMGAWRSGMFDAIRSGVAELTPEFVESVIEKHFVEQIGLQGSEQKNLVPADWVSSVIFRIVQDPDLHGQTYHITNPRPVTLSAIIASMRDAVMSFLPQITANTSGVPGELLAPQGFRSLMDPYRTFFGNDPQFDSTHTQSIPAVQACPDLDHEMLVKLWKFAIDSEFSVRKNSASLAPTWDVEQLLSKAFVRSSPAKRNQAVWAALEVNGPGGGIWQIGLEKQETGWVASMFQRAEVANEAAVRYYVNSRGFAALLNGEMSVEESIYRGQLFAQASESTLPDLQTFAQQIFAALQVASRAHSGGYSDATDSVFSQRQLPETKEKSA